MMKLRSKRFCRSNSKFVADSDGGGSRGGGGYGREIQWELRPGGMLVQKRENGDGVGEGMITVKVSNVSQWHDISIQATSTFGDLKTILSLATNLEPKEQRLLFKGRERDNKDFLHLVGVRDKDKVLLLQDPALKEMKKLHGQSPFCTISV